MQRLRDSMEAEKRHIRLINWARWANTDHSIQGYPTWDEIWSEYIKRGGNSFAIAEIDAMCLEYVISTIDMVGRKQDPDMMHFGCLWAYILKLDYLYAPRPLRAKAELVRFRFRRSFSERSYQRHALRAKDVVFILADPL